MRLISSQHLWLKQAYCRLPSDPNLVFWHSSSKSCTVQRCHHFSFVPFPHLSVGLSFTLRYAHLLHVRLYAPSVESDTQHYKAVLVASGIIGSACWCVTEGFDRLPLFLGSSRKVRPSLIGVSWAIVCFGPNYLFVEKFGTRLSFFMSISLWKWIQPNSWPRQTSEPASTHSLALSVRRWTSLAKFEAVAFSEVSLDS